MMRRPPVQPRRRVHTNASSRGVVREFIETAWAHTVVGVSLLPAGVRPARRSPPAASGPHHPTRGPRMRGDDARVHRLGGQNVDAPAWPAGRAGTDASAFAALDVSDRPGFAGGHSVVRGDVAFGCFDPACRRDRAAWSGTAPRLVPSVGTSAPRRLPPAGAGRHRSDPGMRRPARATAPGDGVCLTTAARPQCHSDAAQAVTRGSPSNTAAWPP